jgi:hypothetical protein
VLRERTPRPTNRTWPGVPSLADGVTDIVLIFLIILAESRSYFDNILHILVTDLSLLSHILGASWIAMSSLAYIVFGTEGEPERLYALTALLVLLEAVIRQPILLSLDWRWLQTTVSFVREPLGTLLHASIIYWVEVARTFSVAAIIFVDS